MLDWNFKTKEEAKRKIEEFAEDNGLLDKGSAILLEALLSIEPPISNTKLIDYLRKKEDGSFSYTRVAEKLQNAR